MLRFKFIFWRYKFIYPTLFWHSDSDVLLNISTYSMVVKIGTKKTLKLNFSSKNIPQKWILILYLFYDCIYDFFKIDNFEPNNMTPFFIKICEGYDVIALFFVTKLSTLKFVKLILNLLYIFCHVTTGSPALQKVIDAVCGYNQQNLKDLACMDGETILRK